MKRDSVEINNRAPQWSHDAVWNRKYMEPKPGYTLRQLWPDSEPAIGHKSSPTYEVKESDIRRAVAAFADLPSSTLPDNPFILALGTPAAKMSHHKLAPWHREPWRNGSAPCVKTRQLRSLSRCKPADRPSSKKIGEMLIAIVLDRPLADAKALVDDPAAFTQEMTRILLEKQSHPLIAQVIKPAGSSDPPPSNSAAGSSGSHEHHNADAPVQFQ